MPKIAMRVWPKAANEVERVRRKVGMSRAQLQRELSYLLPGHDLFVLHIFTTPDDSLPPAMIDIMHAIEEQFDEFVAEITDRLAEYEDDKILSITDVAEITGISEYNVSRLRDRGRIEATPIAVNAYGYTVEAVKALVKFSTEALDHPAYIRGPLANPFLSNRYQASKIKI